MVILSIQQSLSVKNQFFIFQIPLQIYQVNLIHGIFLDSFLDNLDKNYGGREKYFFFKYYISSNKHWASNKLLLLISTTSLGIHTGISESL